MSCLSIPINTKGYQVNIIYHEKIDPSDLPKDALADTYVSFIEVKNVNHCAKDLLTEISDTAWISNLDPIAQMSYEDTAHETIEKLVEIFRSVDNKVTKDFGEFMISMSSGHCLKENTIILYCHYRSSGRKNYQTTMVLIFTR